MEDWQEIERKIELIEEAEGLWCDYRSIISALWAKGDVKAGDFLVSRKEVLKSLGSMKDKTSKINIMYEHLIDDDLAIFDIRYIAKVSIEDAVKEIAEVLVKVMQSPFTDDAMINRAEKLEKIRKKF